MTDGALIRAAFVPAGIKLEHYSNYIRILTIFAGIKLEHQVIFAGIKLEHSVMTWREKTVKNQNKSYPEYQGTLTDLPSFPRASVTAI